MAGLPPVFQRFIDKFSNSRDFTISFTIHAILVALFGTTVLFQVVKEPPDFEGQSFVQPSDAPKTPNTPPVTTPTFSVSTVPTPATTSSSVSAITTTAPSALDFSMDTAVATPVMAAPAAPPAAASPSTSTASASMPTSVASGIKAFTGSWGTKGDSGTGITQREFEFTAYIGKYAGGDWSSTIRVQADGKIDTGSLPNLLYLMSFWSKNKIKTNYKNVQAIQLDSDEIFKIKPPFIFMTGTQDFVLTPKEVDNLQKYIRLGGCVWGDSSVPGLRSRFDLAFRREMKRVIPDVDKNFEPLPSTHAIFSDTYFPEIKTVPSGLNFYQLPVYAIKTYGEVAIIYTANDYGDMWQMGLTNDGQIDLRQNAQHQFVAINYNLFVLRDIYVRNMNPAALTLTYKFGTNLIIHLLTRWESHVRTAPTTTL